MLSTFEEQSSRKEESEAATASSQSIAFTKQNLIQNVKLYNFDKTIER